MNKKIHSGIMLTLLLIGMLTLAYNIQGAMADWTWTETIYIQADGSVDPDTAPISTVDNTTYTLTDNIVDAAPSSWGIALIIERNNIVLNGAGYKLQGTQADYSKGISLEWRSNVTIKNISIRSFYQGIYLIGGSNNTVSGNSITDNHECGVYLSGGSNDTVSGNTITNNGDGIHLGLSSNNTVSGNTITNNGWEGIYFYYSSDNTVSGNTITNNAEGVFLHYCSNFNTVSGNTITNNMYGVYLSSSSNNAMYHNNFLDSTYQVYIAHTSINVWDDGYPSGGNYWSDYVEMYPDAEEIDGSGIWNTPYVIDDDNQDNYPLMEPWTPPPPIPTTIDELKTKIEELGSEAEIDNQGIVTSLLAKLNVAQKLIEKDKIDEAKRILEDDFIPQVQNLSGNHITPEAADILIQSAEHILSNL